VAKLSLTPEDYAVLDKVVSLRDREFVAVVTSKYRGRYHRSFHVFKRKANQTELVEYENLSSKVKVKANRTDVEGSTYAAAAFLYDKLIDRVYNMPIGGGRVLGKTDYDPETGAITGGGPVAAEEARAEVPLPVKREALRDSFGEHYSEARLAEMEDEDVVVAGRKDDED
jgi:hypothetical protein